MSGEKRDVQFVCMGNGGCLNPCYLGSDPSGNFDARDMKCIFGYKNMQWEKIGQKEVVEFNGKTYIKEELEEALSKINPID